MSEDSVLGLLLGLHAQTSLHPGTGAALGTVDLPVQRERHTQWPNIAGSALKGILRDALRGQMAASETLDDEPRYDDRDADPPEDRRNRRQGSRRHRADATLKVTRLFGPPTERADEFAGALTVTDARLLAFPVRSLQGVFAWTTCPAVLRRFQRDLALAGLVNGGVCWSVPEVPDNQAAAPPDCPCVVPSDNEVVLEEFNYALRGSDAAGQAAAIAGWIARCLLPESESYASTRAQFERQLLVLSDNDFTHFARHATEVTARIKLNYESKTVEKGGLFYQEFLPAESVLYSVVLANQARLSNGQGQSKAELMQYFCNAMKAVPFLQVGGDETTGKGLCGVRLSKGKAV